MKLVEIDNSPAGAVKDAIYKAIDQLHKDPLPVHFPANLEHYRAVVATALFNRTPLPAGLLSDADIEALRVKKHMNSAWLQLQFMGADPQPEDSDIQKDRMEQLGEDMRLGKFNKERLLKEMAQRRETDPQNPIRSVNIQFKLLNGLKGTPEFAIAVQNAKTKKEKATDCVRQLRHLRDIGELTTDNHKMWMRLFRIEMLGGFTKEQLEGGSFFSLAEVGTSRQELDALDPNK
jgi:hypothetical protein